MNVANLYKDTLDAFQKDYGLLLIYQLAQKPLELELEEEKEEEEEEEMKEEREEKGVDLELRVI